MAHKISDMEFRMQVQAITRNFNEMSNDELKTLVECEDSIMDAQFLDCPAARSMERVRASLIESNRKQAQENIEKKTRFFDLRNTLLKIYQEAKEQKKSIEEMQDRNPQLKAANTELDSIQAALEAAAREAEDASEKIAADFLNSTISAEEFLSSFVDKRRESQLKRVNAEKVVGLVRQQQQHQLQQVALNHPQIALYPARPPMMPPMAYNVQPYPPYPGYGPPGPMSMPTPGT